MISKERKRRLLLRIHQTQDEQLIAEIERLLNTVEDDQKIYQLSPDQKAAVQEALIEIEKGNHFSEEEVEREIEKWLED